MAVRKNRKAKLLQKPAASHQASPAIEQHLMHLGAHHSVETHDEHSRGGCTTRCVFSNLEQRCRTRARAVSPSQI